MLFCRTKYGMSIVYAYSKKKRIKDLCFTLIIKDILIAAEIRYL